MQTIVFRADASPSLGGGHVMRCLALADELRRGGAECIFAHTPQTPIAVPALPRAGYRSVELPTANDTDTFCGAIADGCDWLVVDHYGWTSSEEKRCRPWARNILVIDDLADRPHDCDLLLDQTLARSASAYKGLVLPGCDLMLGTHYALLRPEFAMARAASLMRRGSGKPKHVLVSVGLTDPAGATGIILDGIRESRLPLTVDVVLGPSASNLAAVRSIVEAHHDDASCWHGEHGRVDEPG